jgi:hypothetical protein
VQPLQALLHEGAEHQNGLTLSKDTRLDQGSDFTVQPSYGPSAGTFPVTIVSADDKFLTPRGMECIEPGDVPERGMAPRSGGQQRLVDDQEVRGETILVSQVIQYVPDAPPGGELEGDGGLFRQIVPIYVDTIYDFMGGKVGTKPPGD